MFTTSSSFPDDGLIQQSDVREVMKAAMEENGMKFDEREIENLAQALYEDAAGLAAGEANPEGLNEVRVRKNLYFWLLVFPNPENGPCLEFGVVFVCFRGSFNLVDA